MIDGWHHISVRVIERMAGFYVTCSCGWQSNMHDAAPGLENWISAQDAAEEDRKLHAASVCPEQSIWTAGPIRIRPSDYPSDHFINQIGVLRVTGND